MTDKKYYFNDELLYDQLSLQAYILFAAQDKDNGGFKDNPEVCFDMSHSNYGTFGLISSQECLTH